MQIVQMNIPGVYHITPEPMKDERGYFMRTFCTDELSKHGISFSLVQASLSFNREKGTIRGMHFQKSPDQEDKIVQCLNGVFYDVAVDIRPGSPTYGQWTGIELSAERSDMLLIPKGCAHGFQTLTENCMMQYFMSARHASESAAGIRWNDPMLNISWPLAVTQISEKDRNWPDFDRVI